MTDSGDCFVVLSGDGLFWDGHAWVREWQRARQFAGPVDPSAECESLADQLRLAGTPCSVAYVPRAKIAPVQPPHLRPRRQRPRRENLPADPPPPAKVNLDVNDLHLGVDRLHHDPDGVHQLADAGLGDAPTLGCVEQRQRLWHRASDFVRLVLASSSSVATPLPSALSPAAATIPVCTEGNRSGSVAGSFCCVSSIVMRSPSPITSLERSLTRRSVSLASSPGGSTSSAFSSPSARTTPASKGSYWIAPPSVLCCQGLTYLYVSPFALMRNVPTEQRSRLTASYRMPVNRFASPSPGRPQPEIAPS